MTKFLIFNITCNQLLKLIFIAFSFKVKFHKQYYLATYIKVDYLYTLILYRSKFAYLFNHTNVRKYDSD